MIDAVDWYSFAGIFTPFTFYDTTLLSLVSWHMYIRNENHFILLYCAVTYIVPF